jgi:foldase protein PrsA
MKKLACALVFCSLLLAGCGRSQSEIQDQNETLFTIGDTTYTKGDEYELIKNSEGTDLLISLALTKIYDTEIGRTDEIQEEAQEQYDELVEANEGFEDQLIAAGYEDGQQYIDNILIPSIQSQKLTEKYFELNETAIKEEYKPSIAEIIQCDDEETAQKALDAIKDGTSVEDAAEEYASETASFTGSEQVVTTLNTTLPTRLINSLFDATEDGVIDEVFVNDDETSYYVAVLVSNDYSENISEYVTSLSSNSDLAKEVVIYYLTEYSFEVHDQYLFDQLKLNNPEYLVTRPDLSE